MSIRLDEASAGISLRMKAEKSSDCNKNGSVKTQVGGLFVTLGEGREEPKILQSPRATAQNHCPQ
jgi:hypothetical protein